MQTTTAIITAERVNSSWGLDALYLEGDLGVEYAMLGQIRLTSPTATRGLIESRSA